MISGNSVNLQFAEESTYAEKTSPKVKLNISSESFNDVLNKTEEGLLTGGIGGGVYETMEASTEGDISTLAKPTSIGYVLKYVMGVEEVTQDTDNTSLYHHVFTPIGNAEEDYLPSITVTIDRKASAKAYLGVIFNTLNLSASAGDRVRLTVGTLGKMVESGSVDTSLTDTGDSEKSFKFYQGKFELDDGNVAKVTSVTFDYNNNCENVQTNDSGKYHEQPKPKKREATIEVTALYSAELEKTRGEYWLEDKTGKAELYFTDSNNNILKIEFPKCQVTTMDQANADSEDNMDATMTLTAIDNTEAFVKITLTNTRAEAY